MDEELCQNSITKYSKFYEDMEKSIKLEFLDKRRLSHSDVGFKEGRKRF